MTGDVGEGNQGDEKMMGRCCLKDRNEASQTMIDYEKRMEMATVDAYLKKKEEHQITHRTGSRFSQVDCILYYRSFNLKEIGDYKVLP